MLNVLDKLILALPRDPSDVVKDLVDVTGKSIQTIRRWRRDPTSVIDAESAIKMADFFNVTVPELYAAPLIKRVSKPSKSRKNDSLQRARFKTKK